MIVISHRGNLYGSSPNLENSPKYIDEAIKKDLDVEVDVWCKNGELYLGHDKPQYKVDWHFFKERDWFLWCHAKNPEALEELLGIGAHCFFHQRDDVVLTSLKYLWVYPGKKIIGTRSIAVLPEIEEDWNIKQAYGICTDFPLRYKG